MAVCAQPKTHQQDKTHVLPPNKSYFECIKGFVLLAAAYFLRSTEMDTNRLDEDRTLEMRDGRS